MEAMHRQMRLNAVVHWHDHELFIETGAILPELMIPGPAGDLEAHYTPLAGAERTAILCHPHPQYGGSMHDMVLGALEQALIAEGVSCLRFNFRGVGRSAGSYDDGLGEADDLRAVIRFLELNYPTDHLVLAGYSFGGAVVLAIEAETSADMLVLIAPAIGLLGEAAAPETRSLVVVGDSDQFFKPGAICAAFDPSATTVEVLEGADHFSIAMHSRLAPTVRDFLRDGTGRG